MTVKKSPSSYYQKSAFALRISRYAVTLVFLLFLLACIFIFGKDITAENVRLLAKYITLNNGSYSLYTDEFSITADENSDIFIVNDNLAVVRKNNLSLYDLAGQKLFSYDYAYSSPACDFDDRNIIVRDISGTEASVFNTFSKIKSFEFSSGVAAAHINDNGVAIISNEESQKSAIFVYDSDYKQKYKLSSGNKHFNSIELSKNGNYILYSSVASHEGNYNCSLSINDVTKKTSEPIKTYKLLNEFPVRVGYSDDEKSIYAVTDSAIHFFDSNLKLKHTYKFNQSKVENYFIENNILVITEKNNLSGNSVTLTGISLDGKELFELNLPDKIVDISIGESKLFALGWDNIFEISKSENAFSVTNVREIPEKYNAITCDSKDNCYVATNTKFKRVDFIEKKDAEKK